MLHDNYVMRLCGKPFNLGRNISNQIWNGVTKRMRKVLEEHSVDVSGKGADDMRKVLKETYNFK